MADGMAARLARMAKTVSAPTPLLMFLAGPHAERIAACWPAPHDRFLALPAARRHAAAILLAYGQEDAEVIARLVERQKDSEIARRLMGTNDPPPGLMKAMARLGETQWRISDYGLFLDLFEDAQANPVLRHMAEIRPEKLSLIGALPAGLRDAKVVALVPHAAAARDLGLAFDLARKVQKAESGRQIAARWSRAKTAEKLFAMAAEDLEPQAFIRPPAIPALPASFEPVRSRRHLAAIALEFQNCLRDFAADLAMGRMAVYAWRVEPPVALALRWDAAGWRLAEAENPANGEMADAQLRDLIAVLEAADIRTGPGLSTLARRLEAHPKGHGEHVGDSFRDRLELGELWD